ncbi:MAG: methionyl-tRNA formyltransferase [Planctomycetota bacterium]
MRLAFLGSGAFGIPTLAALSSAHELALVVTQPAKPAGRGGKVRPTPVAAWCAEHAAGVPVIEPVSINEADIRTRVRAVGADVWVVIAYGQKLGPALLEGMMAVNLHASLLPRWRGAAPIHHAILSGDTVVGNSVITLAEEMDAGDVLGQSERTIDHTQTTGELHDALADDGAPLMLDVLRHIGDGTVARRAQDASEVTLAPKLSRADARLDLAERADRVRCRINGLSPWPGCSGEVGGTRIKLLRAGPCEADLAGPAGTILDVQEGLVACGEGAVRLLDVQPAGGRSMAFDAFARGRGVESGMLLEPTMDSGRG